MSWIKLTDTAGNPVRLSVEQIVRIRIPGPGEVDAAARTVVDLSNGQMQAVKEPPDQVIEMLPSTQ
jgi:uncharacterized protein YlzI (FlbEa/FlbD family)